ncbi:MAG: CHASE2 domain-containing protein [Pseudomonadota bacterium]
MSLNSEAPEVQRRIGGRHTLSSWVGLTLFGLCTLIHVVLEPGLDAPWRRLWFDTLTTIAERERPADPPVYVIAIDESAIGTFGQWPWPRNILASLVERLKEARVSAIGMDIIFSEPDRLSPVALADWLGSAEPGLREPIAGLGDTDLAFARALTGARVVVPVAAIQETSLASFNETGAQPAVLREDLGDVSLTTFENGLRALPVFQAAAAGHATIVFDGAPDGIVRRVPAVQVISGSDTIMMGPETLRVATDGFFTTVRPGLMGLEIDVENYRFPAERDGTFWMHFGEVETDRYIPAAAVLTGEVGAQELEGKMVLLAVTGLGTVDIQTLASGERVWGVEVHMQMIEQILEGDFMRRPIEIFVLETALLATFGLLLIQTIPRAPPAQSLVMGLAGGIALVGASYVAFRLGWFFDASGPVLGSGIVGAGLVAATLIERDRERLLERSEREAQERARDALLDAAKNMQLSVLPARTFEIPGKVRLAAYLDPAYYVGGDLYDHFLLDDGSLFFLVGDVSGKGIAACQFMGISKRLWKIVAQRMAHGLDKIQTETNNEIALDNGEMLFVTGIVGLLNPETGHLTYSSAGHDQPLLIGPNGPARQLEEFSGPPAGLITGQAYPVGERVLQPGEKLILFSDGVTEALNAQRQDYGMARLISFVDGLPADLSPTEIIEATVADLRAFVGGAEKSDDLTMMVVERL